MRVTPSAPSEGASGTAARRTLDAESRAWVARLNGVAPVRRYAIAELHERLHREARFEIHKRARRLPELSRRDLDDLAVQAAGDALMALLGKLGDYRGDSQFLTWARTFAQLEAPAGLRRLRGRDRLLPADDAAVASLQVPTVEGSPPELVETRLLLRRVTKLIVGQLSQRQRTVLIAVAVNGISPATLALELETSTGAIYKTLHDARTKLRAQLDLG